MFKSRTVFVVGAGASYEAGLPTGFELKEHISRLLDIRYDFRQKSGDYFIDAALRQLREREGSRDINGLLAKRWSIRDNLHSAISIDNYLDAHSADAEMTVCGKLGIVKAILDAESKSKMKPVQDLMGAFKSKDLANTWYLRFFQMLTENVRREEVKKAFENISIITFNYDRCIERYLAQCLSSYYGIPEEDANGIVRGVQIYHPYGRVGPLPWQDSGRGIPFGSNERNDLLSIAAQINTFAEGLHDSDLRDGMRSLIERGETLVFLGFAFHPQNLELIMPPSGARILRVFGTTLNVSASDEGYIEKELRTLLKPGATRSEQRSIEIELAPVTCTEFFDRYWRSLPAAVGG